MKRIGNTPWNHLQNKHMLPFSKYDLQISKMYDVEPIGFTLWSNTISNTGMLDSLSHRILMNQSLYDDIISVEYDDDMGIFEWCD